MSFKHNVSQLISQAVFLFRKKVNGTRVLMYHSIGGKALGDDLGIFSVSRSQFQEQVLFLSQQSDLSFVALESLIHASVSNGVVVTFDDGYRDNLTVAAPLLVEYHIPFTVFVSTAFIKKGNKDFLSEADLKELSTLPGVTIGSHGVSHNRFTQCSDDELDFELEASKKYLEDIIGHPVVTMAYPYGDMNQRVVDHVKKTGYQLAVSSQPGVNKNLKNKYCLRRTEILNSDTMKTFEQKLAGAYDWQAFIKRKS